MLCDRLQQFANLVTNGLFEALIACSRLVIVLTSKLGFLKLHGESDIAPCCCRCLVMPD